MLPYSTYLIFLKVIFNPSCWKGNLISELNELIEALSGGCIQDVSTEIFWQVLARHLKDDLPIPIFLPSTMQPRDLVVWKGIHEVFHLLGIKVVNIDNYILYVLVVTPWGPALSYILCALCKFFIFLIITFNKHRNDTVKLWGKLFPKLFVSIEGSILFYGEHLVNWLFNLKEENTSPCHINCLKTMQNLGA